MSWPRSEQVKAERAWFLACVEEVNWKCGGSVISGRRTKTRNTKVGGHPDSLHMEGLASDCEYDSASGYGRAWDMGRSLGLHGYKKPGSKGIHWQARPAKRTTKV